MTEKEGKILVIGCLILASMLIVDWFCAENRKAEGTLIYIRLIATAIALLCLGMSIVGAVIIAAVWSFLGGVIFRMIGEHREAHTESRSEPEKQDAATSLKKQFDEAVERLREEEAIICSKDLLEQGELIHVMLGFKKLGSEGFLLSKELYLNLLCRLSVTSRQSDVASFYKKMTLNEIDYAIGIIESTDGPEITQYATALNDEKLCWENCG